jgi:endonuclease/exonuclease/phosphatase family metal-dependent hydrolase
MLHPERPDAACGAAVPTQEVIWVRAVDAGERADADRWCAAVGTPAVRNAAAGFRDGVPPLVVVSWNTHVGGGDIERLVADVRSGRLTGQAPRSFVLLLQEVLRHDDSVPERAPAGSRLASAVTPTTPDRSRRGIEMTASALGLSMFYVPSMRNGEGPEDRGNAILSSITLDDLEAIELPLERQRRVAVAADIRIRAAAPVTIRIVSVHFTNMVAHHLWVLSEPGRVRQAHALTMALDDDRPTVLGGDLNSWFGYSDAAFRELARVLPLSHPEDRRATFGPMRLDHVLARLPDGWQIRVRRAESRYGSDHYPLIATIDAPH